MKRLAPHLFALALVLAPLTQGAGWLDRLRFRSRPATNTADLVTQALSQEQIIAGLKEALGKGVEHAIAALGKPDGFLQDLSVKIPMPDQLRRVESSLRLLGQDRLADDFITTLNRAAEQAVPEAASVLAQAVRQLTLTDATAILTGTNNAATQFFRRTSETNLFERFHPIVARATEQTGVTSAYKQMLGKAGFAATFLGPDAADLDGYITRKALDGLFLKIALEEKRIRENPVARTTDILQKVFGSLQR